MSDKGEGTAHDVVDHGVLDGSTVEYDSDDPEAWGPYYWSSDERASSAGVAGRAWDAAKWSAFKTYRAMDFAGLVLIDFFGLNPRGISGWMPRSGKSGSKSRKSWRERQREGLRRAQREREEAAKLGELEGGS